MNKKYLTLSGRIREELSEIAVIVDRTETGWKHVQQSRDVFYLDSVALNLHSVIWQTPGDKVKSSCQTSSIAGKSIYNKKVIREFEWCARFYADLIFAHGPTIMESNS